MAARPASGLGKRSNVAPSMARIVSPAWRPAAWAGDPAWTSAKVRPPWGVASQAMPKKMTKATRRFIATPARSTTSFFHSRWTANERGSSDSPSSPSRRTKPPIGSQFRV